MDTQREERDGYREEEEGMDTWEEGRGEDSEEGGGRLRGGPE
jgi:hypothetical protein